MNELESRVYELLQNKDLCSCDIGKCHGTHSSKNCKVSIARQIIELVRNSEENDYVVYSFEWYQDKKKMKTFIDLVVSGEKQSIDLQAYIEEWYNNPEEIRPMHEYLGLTYEEYMKYLLDESYIYRKIDQKLDPTGVIRIASKFVDELNGRREEPKPKNIWDDMEDDK